VRRWPIDAEALARVLSSCRAVVTVEEHNTNWGTEQRRRRGHGRGAYANQTSRRGHTDAYTDGATLDDVRKLLGLTPEAVADVANVASRPRRP